MSNRQIGRWKSFEIDISDSTTTSDECNLGGCFDYILLDVPTITSSTLTVQIARASGGTFRNLQEVDADGTNAVVTSDAGTGAFMWAVPIHGGQFIKIVAGSAQAADRTFYVRGIGRHVELE